MTEWIWRLKSLLRRNQALNERSEEMQFHFDMEVEAGIRRGLAPEEARRQATLRAGRLSASVETTREALGFRWLDGLAADLRHATRALLRNRSFGTVAIAVLTVSVAINTIVFFLLEGVVLRPLPYASPDRLIRVYDEGKEVSKFPVRIGHYLDYRTQAKSLDGVALYTGADMELSQNGERPERLTGVAITSEFFTLLGRSPILGRSFTHEDLRPNVRTVILSHRLWRDSFQSDPAIVGKTVRLDREPWTVVGVAPPGFQHVGGAYRSPLQGETVDIWLPLNVEGQGPPIHAFHYCNAIARLRDGFSATQARDELAAIADSHNRRFPDFGNWSVSIQPLLSEVTGRSRQIVWLLAAAGGFVLLVACASIAGLCIARAMARQRELDLRRALGASRWQLLRVGLTENLMIGIVGASAGILLAALSLPVLRQLLPVDFPRAHEVALTPQAALFAAGIAILTVLAAGLAPFARTKASPVDSAQRVTASRETHRLRTALVVSEIVFAGLLCAGSLFLLRSYQEINARDHGFNPSGALTFQLTVPEAAVDRKQERLIRALEQIRLKILDIPGVQSAGATTNLPWSGYDENSSFGIVGRQRDNNQGPNARFQAATPGYFEAAGMRLIDGRLFDVTRDRKGQPFQVIVNDALATKYFPSGDATGSMLDLWGEKTQIAGVVAGIRDFPADPDIKPAFWFPIAQRPFSRVFFTVRMKVAEDAVRLAPAVTAAVHAIDPELPVADLRTLEQQANGALASRRFALWLFQAFAILGLTLAAAGLYGLLAYLVQQRRKEFGVRAALGASRADIGKLVVTDGLRIALLGAACCALLIPVGGSLLKAFLYNVESYDPWTLGGALAVLLVVSIAASLSPAWTATRCDPASSLRQD